MSAGKIIIISYIIINHCVDQFDYSSLLCKYKTVMTSYPILHTRLNSKGKYTDYITLLYTD